MFTTLPLELFVCREVRTQSFPDVLLIYFLQVVEQFFFSHESFSQQRHIFFTTTIIVASMFSMCSLPSPLASADNLSQLLSSLATSVLC